MDNWDHIKKVLIIYLAEIAIPRFRKNKQSQYIYAMQDFSYEEMKNAERQLECWGDF